jgi:outer membrane protein assembly factor BamA
MGMTLLALVLLTQTPVTTDSQPIISSVEVRLPAGADEHLIDRVPQLVTVHKGQPLSRRAVERTIESLFATSRFADIEVLAKDAPDGVTVIIVLTPRQNIGTVFLEGNRSFAKTEVLGVTKLEPGSEYWPERLERAADAVRKFYQRRGYRNVSVRTEAASPRAFAASSSKANPGSRRRSCRKRWRSHRATPPISRLPTRVWNAFARCTASSTSTGRASNLRC